MCHIVISLGHYGIKKATKTNKFQGMQLQLSPVNTTDAT